MPLGKNKAIQLIQYIPFWNMYDNRVPGLKHVNELENFDYEELVNYLSKLNISYEVLKDFFSEDLDFCDINGEETGDESDYFVIDDDGIYCWTEVLGRTYHLKDYNIRWKELSKEKVEEKQKRWEEQNKHSSEYNTKIFEDYLKMATEVLPKLYTSELVKVTPMPDFRNAVKSMIKK